MADVGSYLVQRDDALVLFEQACASAGGDAAGLLMLEGCAGAGKSAALRAAAGLAESRGLRVLRAAGSELERDFSYGVVRQLLEGMAEPAAFGGDPCHDSDHELFGVLARLAERTPVLLAIDDLDLVDEPSLGFLCHVAQRRNGHRLVTLATANAGHAAAAGSLGLLRIEQAATVLPLEPLGVEAITRLLARTGRPGAVAEAQAIQRRTAGNPFLVTSLIDHGTGASVPPAVVRHLALRLARLPDEAGRLARVAAVLGDGASVTAAARALEVRPAAALDALDVLAGAGILRRSGQIEFSAPLLRDATLELLGHGERSRLHRRAAHALDAAGAPAAAVAAQLMQSDGAGESWAAAALRRAAGQAGERRARITFLQRALAEEPPAPARAELLVELAAAELAGRGADAARHLADAVRLLPPGTDRSAACEQLGLVLWGLSRYAEAGRAFAAGLDGLGALGGSLAGRLGAGCVAAARVGSEIAPGGRIPLDGAALGEAPAEPAIAAELALQLLLAGGRHDRVVELAMAALGGDPSRRRSCGSPALQAAVCALVWADALDAAEQAASEAIEAGTGCDPDPAIGVMLLLRACARHRRGRLAEAQADALAAKARAPVLLPVPVQPPAALLAEIRLELGQVAEGAASAQRARDAAAMAAGAGTGGRAGYAFALAAQGRVELALGQPRAALESLLDCGRRMEEAEVRSPALIPWRSLAAVAALRIGERERPAALAAEELALAEALGSPRARGLALRAGASARQRGERLDELQAAAAALERSPGVLDRAHALADLGAELRRSGQRRASRDALRRALDLASRCGAEALVRCVRQELLATGARPRRTRISGVASLTPREREIAELAALGRSNRAIAAHLVVSEKTIEWHLANTYRKLEIRGRGGLAQTLEQK